MSAVAGVLRAGVLSARDGDRGGASPGSGRPTCLLDGTIFNLREVAARVGAAATDPPEEILLAAHRRWGEEAPGHLRGNFAMAICDPVAGSALLACDQLGGRSVFFHRAAGATLTFAGDVRDLLRLLPSRPPPDEAALVAWIAGAPAHATGTLYRGVARLGPGELLSVSGRGAEVRCYWAPRYSQPLPLSRPEAAAMTGQRLAAAVRRHVPEHAACGVLLSGGLDSSSVAALAGDGPPGGVPPRAYSALFPDHPSIDESGLIGDVVSDLGLASSTISVRGGSMLRGSLEYLREWELPAASPNHFLWQPLLRRAAADGVALMLDGEGGDELWKASPYLLADEMRHGRALSTMRLARAMAGIERYRGWRSLTPYLSRFGLKGAAPASLQRAVRRAHGPARYAPEWLGERSAGLLFEQEDPWAWKRLDGPRWWAYMADLLTGARARLGVADYLRHRATMAGLEDRHPLLDLDLVEFALSLPPTLAVDARLERPLLRDAMAGSIPDSIRLRPEKSYFTALIDDCLGGRDVAPIRGLLTGTPEVERYLRPGAIDALLESPGGSSRTDLARSWSIWRLATAECWLRAQADGDFAAGLLEQCAERDDDWVLSPA
jgi:asparagine synthase (glutamine-hydrolysing)